jgi:hypothetical protein
MLVFESLDPEMYAMRTDQEKSAAMGEEDQRK